MKYAWTLDESLFAGVTNYLDMESVAVYDQRMRTVRDVDFENRVLLELIDRYGGLGPNKTVLEIGTGTGAFARAASSRFRDVRAVDISSAMLKYAEKKTQEAGIDNVRFEQAGFLSFDNSRPVDTILSSLALHHINDVWKAEALHRIAEALVPGGLFVLVDVIFDCQGGELDKYVEKAVPKEMNEQMKQDLYGHIARENSTLRWIMEEIIQRSGLEIVQVEKFSTIAHLLVCRKPEH